MMSILGFDNCATILLVLLMKCTTVQYTNSRTNVRCLYSSMELIYWNLNGTLIHLFINLVAIFLINGSLHYPSDKKKIYLWFSNVSYVFNYRYEGAAANVPYSNNGCESLNGKIKQHYTLRNKLHASSFLPKIEQMLNDWSKASLLNGFKIKPSISIDIELSLFKWSNNVNKIDILRWFDCWYIVPSYTSSITPAIWLHSYQNQEWTSFDQFVIWLKSCYIVSPLNSCTCPMGMKHYISKHSLGLAIMFQIYDIKEKSHSHILGKCRGRGKSKKVKTALLH